MEDPQEMTAPSPIKCCTLPFRIRRRTLALREISQLCALILAILCIIGTCVVYVRPPITYSNIDIRWCALTACFIVFIQHFLTFINLLTNGWGSSQGRFWCDVKIMFVRGFNTIRTTTRLVAVSVLYIQLALLMGCSSLPALLLLVALSIMSEFQAGIAENQNQYDVQTHEKFISDDHFLEMEQVHQYQLEHPLSNVKFTPIFLYGFLNVYMTTILLTTRTLVDSHLVFETPVVVLIILFNVFLPICTHLCYLKGLGTFCELELCRSAADTLLLTLLMLFTLV
jgi:hypothetical protein